MTPAGPGHGYRASSFLFLITRHVRKHKLGRTYAAETGFLLERNPDTVRAPDVAFVCKERVIEVEKGFFPDAPDLVVEVVSPSERIDDVMEKVESWLEAGVRLAWVAWPQTRSVTEHRSGQPQRMFHDGDSLEGGDVLPGFTCEVREIFD